MPVIIEGLATLKRDYAYVSWDLEAQTVAQLQNGNKMN